MMIRNEVIIGVADVARSSRWYQSLLECKSAHGGEVFEILADQDGTVILCLHKWGEHGHPTLMRPGDMPGNGLIFYLRVADLWRVWKNALKLQTAIESPPGINPNSGKEEFAIRDLDGYYLLVSL